MRWLASAGLPRAFVRVARVAGFRPLVLGLVLGGLALSGCGASSTGPCSSTGSLEVTLVNTASDAPICDATVTLGPEDGGAGQPLIVENEGGPGCYYFISVTPATYKLVAADMGFVTLSQSLIVTPDGCGVESPSLALELVPTM